MRTSSVMKGVAAFKNRWLKIAWNSWTDFLAYQYQIENALRLAVFQWVHKKLSTAMTQWRDITFYITGASKIQRNSDLMALKHWLYHSVANAFRTWRMICSALTEEALREEAEREELEALLRRIRELEEMLGDEQDARNRAMQEAVSETTRLAEALASLETLYDEERARTLNTEVDKRDSLVQVQRQLQEAEARAEEVIHELRMKLQAAQEEVSKKTSSLREYELKLTSLRSNYEEETDLTTAEIKRLKKEVTRLQSLLDESAKLPSFSGNKVIKEEVKKTQVTRASRQQDKAGANPMRWEWEDENHVWVTIHSEVSSQLEEAEKSRLGRLSISASFGGADESECTFLLNQRKVVVNDSGMTYLIRRRQPKIAGGSPGQSPLAGPGAVRTVMKF